MEITIKALKEAKSMIEEAAQTINNQEDFTSENFVNVITQIYRDVEKKIRKSLHKHGVYPPPSPPPHQ
jgi:hypothetical protein